MQLVLDSMNITIFMYTNIVDYSELFEHLEKMLMRDILKVLESENVKMAYPGQNVYVHQVDDEYNVERTE